ncbi:hypothetical protein Lgra_2900 [Legionella gratiana]|uniref:Uncharacterized protein n=1 Tax=Legionella gratiana TaxID=45066 RepID=A0A378J7M2_9GAMM|nr:hypothetical protein [Legionella gratiana]KTD06123.1 hypothetical protein Lgra_2900 [Legionella gratiana]STX42907.1 Uncharacterised protein [Legionella gratiana]
MPKKKPLEISKEFVNQVLAIIADESEEGRRKIIAIARRAEEKYERPIKSWLTGWFYQYTRTRGEKVEQSIDVMQKFPDAYTRLLEFKLIISDGEWKIGSYNYLLFLELIDAIPDYASIDESFIHSFILELKELVIKQIDSFMFQYKSTLESIKAREIERQTIRQNERQSIENILIFNELTVAKEMLSQQPDKTGFSLSFKNDLWNLFWIDENGETYPLSPSNELILKLTTLEEPNIEKLNKVSLKQIKKECVKARDQYLSKIQVIINPEDKKSHAPLSIENLIINGVTSTFVLRDTEKETNLWWINSMGVSSKISLTDYPKLNSWLATHKPPFNETDGLQFKANLLHIKTTQPFSASKIESMNEMLEKVLKKQGPRDAFTKDNLNIGRLDLESFDNIKLHLEDRVKKIAERTTPVSEPLHEATAIPNPPKKLKPERYTALSQLPNFWRQHDMAEKVEEVQTLVSHLNKN